MDLRIQQPFLINIQSKIELKRSKGNTESRRLQIDDKLLTEIRESVS